MKPAPPVTRIIFLQLCAMRLSRGSSLTPHEFCCRAMFRDRLFNYSCEQLGAALLRITSLDREPSRRAEPPAKFCVIRQRFKARNPIRRITGEQSVLAMPDNFLVR